ncbi:SDR family oxidoreductase [Solihabitans fulvus]|uniref:SDR family oxidoreductase n=1 Tax=Solihabitans fulvus TaxID=1892852 RepID=A0A5B2WP05_9PSEU|nr:SDR family oxidoreductase [Solihabitans fulvus]KAA2252550.1 SDR family oxidoreductase [Solihabitans fulvus]
MTDNTTGSSRIALVTGANKGIGQQIAVQLAELGMTVLLAARDPRRGDEAAAELRAAGGEAHSIALDVTDAASVRAAAAQVDDRFGRLDVLVNNAGISGGDGQSPSSADVDLVRAVFDTNVFGVITVTNAFLPLLLRSAAPRIVNVSSGVGSLAAMADPNGPLAEMPASAAYVPSKTALNSLTVQYAKELRESGVLVNAADPGYCATDLNDHRGFRTAAQGAAIAVQLATLEADGPTGGFFNDEGLVAW